LNNYLAAALVVVVLSACAPREDSDPRTASEIQRATSGLVASTACPTSDSAVFEGTALSRYDGWYGRQLRALKERGFCSAGDSVSERYRFTWLPSFHAAVVVRLEREEAHPRLVAKVLSGAGGYEPGTVARDTTVSLTESEWAALTRRVRATELWVVPQLEPPSTATGLDGAQWILEGVRGGRYNVADRWSPQRDGPYANHRAVGELLLLRSGLVPRELVREY